MAIDFVGALLEIARRKNIPQAELVSLVKEALSLAYRRRYDSPADIEVEVDWEKKEAVVFLRKTVVEELAYWVLARESGANEVPFHLVPMSRAISCVVAAPPIKSG